jgi:hypothetical protein
MASLTASKIIGVDYWCTSFYLNVIVHECFFHILRYLHFENNDSRPNCDDPDYDTVWKIKTLYTLNNKFCEMYSTTERLAVNEVIVLCKGRVIFWQYIPKRDKKFGVKIYRLCSCVGYTYDMSVYLGKQWQHATDQITVTYGTLLRVIHRVERPGHKIFVDNYFISAAVLDDLFQHKIGAFGIVRSGRHGMPQDIGPKALKLKRGV